MKHISDPAKPLVDNVLAVRLAAIEMKNQAMLYAINDRLETITFIHSSISDALEKATDTAPDVRARVVNLLSLYKAQMDFLGELIDIGA